MLHQHVKVWPALPEHPRQDLRRSDYVIPKPPWAGEMASLVFEQSGHQGAQAPVGDAGDGAQGDAQGAGQGLDPKNAETHGCSSPPLRGDGGVRDPLEDWIRKDTALASTFSLQHPGVDRTRFGLQVVEVVQAALAADVVGGVDHGLDPQGAPVFEVLLDPGSACRRR